MSSEQHRDAAADSLGSARVVPAVARIAPSSAGSSRSRFGGAGGASAESKSPAWTLAHLEGKPDRYAELCDVVLAVEGVQVPAHSQVLAAASPLFCEMFVDFKRTFTSEEPMFLEDCFRNKTLFQVKALLSCVYGKPAAISSVAEAEALVRIADEYDCRDLLEEALAFLRRKGPALMKNSCDEDSGVLKWALWAQQYRVPDFLAEAEHRIMSNFAVLQNDRRLAELNQDSLLRILCGTHRCLALPPLSLAKCTTKEELMAWARSGRGWPSSKMYREGRRRYME